MIGPLGEDQAGPRRSHRLVHVPADLLGPSIICDHRGENLLDVRRLVVAHFGPGLVDDQLPPHKGDVLQLGGGDHVADRSALQADDGFEPVAAVGRGGKPHPPPRASGLHAGGE